MHALTQQLLEWVGERPRSYAETIDTWKSSCPRLTIWEDAVADGLVRLEGGRVLLSDLGAKHVLARTAPSGATGYPSRRLSPVTPAP